MGGKKKMGKFLNLKYYSTQTHGGAITKFPGQH